VNDEPAFMGEAAGGSVHHPRHYNAHPSGVECIDVIELLPGNLANAVKYAWRCGEKGARVEDLKKCAWYLQRELDRLEGNGHLPERWPWSGSRLCDKVADRESPATLIFTAMVCVDNALTAVNRGREENPGRETYVNNVTLFLSRVKREIELVG
jgi:hypothetical protein